MGGVGKTELATQYSLKHQNLEEKTYPGGICWLYAREQNIGSQIISFTRTKLNKNPPKYLKTPEEKVDWCWTNWEPGETLIVIDDVKDYKTIKLYLPPNEPRFKILITTRNKNLGGSFQKLYLEVLDEESALDLLESFIDESKKQEELEEAKNLCKKLGCLPLGLELVGRYLQEKLDLSLREMQERLDSKGLKHKALQKNISDEMTAQRGVEAAFELSWQELNIAEQELACLISLFALAPIPWSLVKKCLPEEDSKDKLFSLSLLQRKEKGIYQLHELIQEFLRAKQSKLAIADQQKSNFCTTIVVKAKEIPETITLSNINHFTPFIPHLVETATLYQNWLSDEDLIEPFIGISKFYEGQGAYIQALPWRKQCLSVAKERFGEKHLKVASSLNNLGVVYYDLGRYETTESLYLKALEMRKELLEEEHCDIANSLNNLAVLYKKQGRYEEAEPLHLKALEIRKKLLGEEHLDTASSLHNLATLQDDQERYEEAETLYLKALELHKKILGEEHTSVAKNLNNLATLYDKQERYKEAEPLYLKALEIRKKLLGEEHPSIANSINNLATLYSNQRRYEEAETLYLKALELIKTRLREEHPDIANILSSLATLYRIQERYEEAEPLYKQALEIDKKLLGEEHSYIAINLNNLAEIYHTQGRYKEAEPLYKQALEIDKKLLGEEHPYVANNLNNLAILYNNQKRYKEAKTFCLKALEIYKKTLGESNPRTTNCQKGYEILINSQN